MLKRRQGAFVWLVDALSLIIGTGSSDQRFDTPGDPRQPRLVIDAAVLVCWLLSVGSKRGRARPENCHRVPNRQMVTPLNYLRLQTQTSPSGIISKMTVARRAFCCQRWIFKDSSVGILTYAGMKTGFHAAPAFTPASVGMPTEIICKNPPLPIKYNAVVGIGWLAQILAHLTVHGQFGQTKNKQAMSLPSWIWAEKVLTVVWTHAQWVELAGGHLGLVQYVGGQAGGHQDQQGQDPQATPQLERVPHDRAAGQEPVDPWDTHSSLGGLKWLQRGKK